MLVGDTLQRAGTETQLVELACALDRRRWDVHVACLCAEGPLRDRLVAAEITPVSIQRGSFRPWRLVRTLAALAREVRLRDIRVVHSFDFYSNLPGVLAARLTGRPSVASQRELGDLKMPRQRRLQAFLLRQADRVVVNSPAVAERVRVDARVCPSRVVEVPNLVDDRRFAGSRRRPSVTAAPVVGTLANLRPEKGIADLVRAAALVRARYPAARFVVWGDGACRGSIEAEIDRLGVADMVRLAGATAQPERALAEMDLFVLPSLSEATSNALLEAMASGLPVVATRVGGSPLIIDDGISGLLVPPGAPGELAKAVITLLDDPRRGSAMGTAASAKVRVDHGAERVLASLEAVYMALLTGAERVIGCLEHPERVLSR
jgi:L-malate glycosyltransferase